MTTEHYAADAHSRPPPRPPRRWLRIVVVALGLALLGGLGGYVLHKVTRPGGESAQEVPLIRADESPIKKRPAEPGGMAIPNQDKLVYEALSEYGREEKVEVLLPPPEEPLPAPTSAVPRPAAQPAEQPAEAEAPSATPETPETPEPTTEIATAEPEPEATPPSPEPPAEVATAAPAPASPKPAAEAATVAAVPPAAASPAPTAAAKAFMVQLGAYRKAPAADTGWRRLLKANRDLLGDLKPKVVRADLGADKGVFFRLRAGPLGDEAAARALCARLKVRRQGCFVVRP